MISQLGFGELSLEVAHDVLAFKGVLVKRWPDWEGTWWLEGGDSKDSSPLTSPHLTSSHLVSAQRT
jgi:hypothetical protein